MMVGPILDTNCILRKKVVRITSKKTKCVLEDKTELTYKNYIYKPSEEIERRSLVAKSFKFIRSCLYRFERGSYKIHKLSDEDIIEVANKFVEINQIIEKGGIEL